MECEHGWRDATDCDTCTLRRVAPQTADRIAGLELQIAYAITEIDAGRVAEARAELASAIADMYSPSPDN